jgi:hypothetical protein
LISELEVLPVVAEVPAVAAALAEELSLHPMHCRQIIVPASLKLSKIGYRYQVYPARRVVAAVVVPAVAGAVPPALAVAVV